MSARPHLNRRLALERLDRVPDGAGGFTDIWMPLGTLWAEIAPRSGQGQAGADVALSVVRHRITLRGAPVGSSMRPLPAQRLRDGARVYVIEAVTERDAGGQYLTVFATEERIA
ncbi:head-tail adaptor protein [Pseudaestuariivita sp.]|uniref:head-tail adaptor protein n=1 Tax=Pseudaestuariivita sp. TaxID=2211669 RepID=UPI0040588761